MYNMNDLSLGQVAKPVTTTTKAPSLWDKFSNVFSKTMDTGFNVWQKVEQIKQAKAIRSQAEAAARQQLVVGQPVPIPGYAPSYGAGMDWTWPIVIGGGALVVVLALSSMGGRK